MRGISNRPYQDVTIQDRTMNSAEASIKAPLNECERKDESKCTAGFRESGMANLCQCREDGSVARIDLGWGGKGKDQNS